jgi:lipoprotein LprG
MKTRALALIAATVLVLTGAAGCGGTKKSDKPVPQRLAAAQKFLDQTDGVRIGLSTPTLPQGVQGVLNATGIGTKQPAFKGDITVVQNGLSVKVPVVAVDGKVQIQFGGKWQVIDPKKFGAPDPAALFTTDGGLATILTDVQGAKAGKDTRDGKRVLSTITGKVSGQRVSSIIPSAAATKDFPATFTLDDTDHLTKVVLTGPFYPKAGDVTYTITFGDYGSTTIITAP